MRLIDLEPKWLIFEGRRVGFIFRCPTDKKWWQTCFVELFNLFGGAQPLAHEDDWGTPDSQNQIVLASAPEAGGDWQPCNSTQAWTVAGGIENASFETISVTPSLDGSRGGLWHGFITNGEIVGGI